MVNEGRAFFLFIPAAAAAMRGPVLGITPSVVSTRLCHGHVFVLCGRPRMESSPSRVNPGSFPSTAEHALPPRARVVDAVRLPVRTYLVDSTGCFWAGRLSIMSDSRRNQNL